MSYYLIVTITKEYIRFIKKTHKKIKYLINQITISNNYKNKI
jgi:hypothetical protein